MSTKCETFYLPMLGHTKCIQGYAHFIVSDVYRSLVKSLVVSFQIAAMTIMTPANKYNFRQLISSSVNICLLELDFARSIHGFADFTVSDIQMSLC